MTPVVTGCPRSGTTLLRMMLDSHPGMAIPPETTFLLSAARHRGSWGDEELAALARLVVRDPSFLRLGIDPGVVGDWARSVRTPRDLMTTVFREHARLQGAPRWGLKNPRYLLHIDDISRLLPETAFIHLIRDGRDVAASLRDIHFGADTLAAAAAQWRYRVVHGRELGRALGAGRYLELRYERLVSDPKRVVQSVCDFIGLDFHPDMLEYMGRKHRYLTGDRADLTHSHLGEPPRVGVRDWRTDLTAAEIRVIEGVCGPTLSALGYAVARPRRSLLGVGAVASNVIREQVRIARTGDEVAREVAGVTGRRL